jgi:hypothetical protein
MRCWPSYRIDYRELKREASLSRKNPSPSPIKERGTQGVRLPYEFGFPEKSKIF